MLHDELTLKERIRLEEARLRDEALRMLARAMKIYASELVTIRDFDREETAVRLMTWNLGCLVLLMWHADIVLHAASPDWLFFTAVVFWFLAGLGGLITLDCE